MANNDPDKKGKFWVTTLIVIIISIFVPLTIAYLVFNENVLPKVPGYDELWFGFWASFSGTIVSVFVAIYTYKNNKALESVQEATKAKNEEYQRKMAETEEQIRNNTEEQIKLTKKLENLQQQVANEESEFQKIVAGINLRVQDVLLYHPGRVLYEFEFEESLDWKDYILNISFENAAYGFVEKMEIQDLYINGEKVCLDLNQVKYRKQGKVGALVIPIKISDLSQQNSKVIISLNRFYKHFQQYMNNPEILTIELEVIPKIWGKQSASNMKYKVKIRILPMDELHPIYLCRASRLYDYMIETIE